jgi:hypothetical protein
MRIGKGAILCGLLIATTLMTSRAHAKRVAPKEIRPVVAAGVRYKVPHFGAVHDKPQNGGYVQAWDIRTGKLLWDRMIYRVRHDPALEGDVQDVFITGIRLKKRTLRVTNDRSEAFEMDLKTGKVRALTALGAGRELPTTSEPH